MGTRKGLPPGLRIRAGQYHYRFMFAGVVYSGRTGYAATARNLTRALKKLADARNLVEAGEPEQLRLSPRPFSDAAMAFCDWADGEYKAHPATARRLRTSMASCCEFFGRTPLHAIGAGELEDYKAWRRSCGIREITIRHDLHALSKLYQHGMSHRWCNRNATAQIAIPSDRDAVRQHVLTEDEEAAYFGAMIPGSTLADCAKLMLLTGMRPEETLALGKAHVDLDQGTLLVARGKTAAARRLLALVPDALEILRRRVASQGPHIFPGRGNSVHRVNGAHDRLLHRHNNPTAGAKPEIQLSFVLYDLRHTFATRMAEAGCPLPVLAAILGHANLRSIHRYVHVRPAVQQEAMLKYALSSRSKIGPSGVSKQGGSEGFTGQEDSGLAGRPN
jgi:site-specific recombinase XerD